jgi:hypothetical protein
MLIKAQKKRVKLYVACLFVKKIAKELLNNYYTRKNALFRAIQ